MKLTTTFVGGMDKDTTKDKFQPTKYYHAENLRVLTDEGSTTGSIATIKGNVPTTIIVSGDSYNGDLSSFTIKEHVTLRNDIILFYYNLSGETKIVLLKYIKEGEYRQILLSEFALTPHFERDVDLHVVARYENNEVQKLYWSDGSYIRWLNFAPDTNLSGELNSHYTTCRATTLQQMERFPRVSSGKPSFTGYTSGGLRAGVIQYAYRFYKKYGNYSAFSELSDVIALSQDLNSSTKQLRGQDTAGQDLTIVGENTAGINTGKGVTLSIQVSSNDASIYDGIEIVSLWYSKNEGIPDINIIEKRLLGSSGTLTVVDNGDTTFGNIEIEEFRELQTELGFLTSAIKDDRLFIGKLKESYFDIDEELGYYFDTRAYSYKNDGSNTFALALDDGGTTGYIEDGSGWKETDITNSTFPYSDDYVLWAQSTAVANPPEDADCISPSSVITQDSHIKLRPQSDEFIYKSNGVTHGGTGPNISFSVNPHPYKIANVPDDNTDEVYNLNIGVDGTNEDYILGRKRGWQRGEVYRFFIVFIDSSGRYSFPKWITDYKMPESTIVQTDGITLSAKPLVPFFTVSNLPAGYSWQIAYVKRDEANTSVLYSGLLHSDLKDAGQNSQGADLRRFYYSGTDNGSRYKTTGSLLENEFTSPEFLFNKAHFHSSNLMWRTASKFDNFISSTVNPADDPSKSDVSAKFWEENIAVDARNANIGNSTLYVDSKLYDEFTLIGDILYNSQVVNAGGDELGRKGTCMILQEIDNNILVPNSTAYGHIVRTNEGQYGGRTYQDKLLNECIPASAVNDGNCVYGDTFISMFDYQRVLYQDSVDENKKITEVWYFPVESKINLNLRHDDCFSKVYPSVYARFLQEEGNVVLDGETVNYSDLYLYSDAYSREGDATLFIGKPLDFSTTKVYDTMIRYSDLKLNGEEIDSWLSFKANNFNEPNTAYGKLLELVEFNDNVLVFQPNGIAVASINKQVQIADDVGVALTLGQGDILDRFDYISSKIGLLERSDVVQSYSGLYFLGSNYKMYRLTQGLESIAELSGLKGYMNTTIDDFSSLKGVYDAENSEVILTVENDNNNAVYTKASPTVLTGDSINQLRMIVGNTYDLYDVDGNLAITTEYLGTSTFFPYSLNFADTLPDVDYDLSNYLTAPNRFTISYNELLNSFISFYSFRPDFYIRTNNTFISVVDDDLWNHNMGDFSTFYGELLKAVVEITYSNTSKEMADFYNYEFYLDVIKGNEHVDKTIKSLQAFNTYQHSEELDMYPYTLSRDTVDLSGLPIPDPTGVHTNIHNIRKAVNKWKTIVPRITSSNYDNRAQDYYLLLRIVINNNDAYKYVLHDPSISTREWSY